MLRKHKNIYINGFKFLSIYLYACIEQKTFLFLFWITYINQVRFLQIRVTTKLPISELSEGVK
jgi:hypothetical protein